MNYKAGKKKSKIKKDIQEIKDKLEFLEYLQEIDAKAIQKIIDNI